MKRSALVVGFIALGCTAHRPRVIPPVDRADRAAIAAVALVHFVEHAAREPRQSAYCINGAPEMDDLSNAELARLTETLRQEGFQELRVRQSCDDDNYCSGHYLHINIGAPALEGDHAKIDVAMPWPCGFGEQLELEYRESSWRFAKELRHWSSD